MTYENKVTPRWSAPLIAGWYKFQPSFMKYYALGIQHYGFEGFGLIP